MSSVEDHAGGSYLPSAVAPVLVPQLCLRASRILGQGQQMGAPALMGVRLYDGVWR